MDVNADEKSGGLQDLCGLRESDQEEKSPLN